MRAMVDSVAPQLRTLPTGETWRYEFYIRPIIEDLVAQGALESKRPGQWRTSRERTIYRPAGGKKLTGDMMDLGYFREAQEAVPVFNALRAERDLSGVTLQLGMATDFTMAFVALGPKGVWHSKKAFTDATVRDIVAIRELAGADVVIQLEATAELLLMAKTQPLHRLADRALGIGRGIAGIAAASPPGTRFGVHLCLGSMNNKARATLRTIRPAVDLANSIARQWPAERTLTFVHAPFAAGDIPPSAKPKFYAPLAKLALPAGTAFYAGMVHESPTEAEQLHTLHLIEQALGRPVDGVATACGLGRRPRTVADALMARANTLAAKG